jgi:hypothetical protein
MVLNKDNTVATDDIHDSPLDGILSLQIWSCSDIFSAVKIPLIA